MSTEQTVVTCGLLFVILLVMGSMLLDAFSTRRNILSVGAASWYHGGGVEGLNEPMACISRGWAAGTRLRVYNSAGVFVDVRVIAPPEPFKPSRDVLLHLSRDAFVLLAPLGINFIHVQVERIERARERAEYRRAVKEGVLE
jgi:hypothetical protein